MPALNEVTGDDDQAALADTESYVILLLADSGLPTGERNSMVSFEEGPD